MEQNTVHLLKEARNYSKNNQFLPAINLLQQILEVNDTIELREELIELLQKIKNHRACAEESVIIGYRLLSKEDNEGAIKAFARALKFNPQEYEALEKLAEICNEFPKVTKKLAFNFDHFLLENFKIHCQQNHFVIVEKSYNSIADLLSPKSAVHTFVAKEFSKENLQGISETKRLELLSRVYSIQKRLGKAKKIYKQMMTLDENAHRKSGLIKSLDFVKGQEKQRRFLWWKWFKVAFLLALIGVGFFFYFLYHQRAQEHYKQVQNKSNKNIVFSMKTISK
jgi:tetratricopeptide (TPR) repeat protein